MSNFRPPSSPGNSGSQFGPSFGPQQGAGFGPGPGAGFAPATGAGFGPAPGPGFRPPQRAPQRGAPVMAILLVTFGAILVGGIIGADSLLTLVSPSGGFSAVARGLFISALAFGAWIAVMVGLVRHRSNQAAFRAPVCLVGNGLLALIGLWCVIHMATIDMRRPGRTQSGQTQTAANNATGAFAGGSSSNKPNNASSQLPNDSPAGKTGTPPTSPGNPLANNSAGSPDASERLEIPGSDGRVPIDRCEWQLPDGYYAAAPDGMLTPIGGNSQRAIEFSKSSNTHRARVVDLIGDDHQTPVTLQPIAKDAGGFVAGTSLNRALAVVAASPSGRHVAILDRSTRDAPVEIYRIAPNVDRVAAYPAWSGKSVDRFVMLPNDTTAIVAKSSDELEWWSLADGRVITTRPGGAVAPTPGNQFVAVGHNDRVGFYDAATGAHVATISVGGGQLAYVMGIAFRADGERMVVHGDGLNGQIEWLAMWDLKASQLLCLVPLPGNIFRTAPTHWLDADLVAVGPYVFSASQRQIVGQFARPATFLGPVGGRTLIRTSDLNDNIWYPFPTSAITNAGNVAELGSRAPVAMRPGDPVQLAVDFSSATPDAKQREEIMQKLRENLRAAGHDVQAAAPTVVRVKVSDVTEPGTVTFQYVRLRNGPTVGDREVATGKAAVIAKRTLHCDATITDATGQPLWNGKAKAGVDDVQGLVDVGLFSNGHEEVYKARWPFLMSDLRRLTPPAAVVDYRQLTQFDWPQHSPPAAWQAKREAQRTAARLSQREESKRIIDLPLVSTPRPWNVPRLDANAPATSSADGSSSNGGAASSGVSTSTGRRDTDLKVTWRDQIVRVHRASNGQELGHCESPAWDVHSVSGYELLWAAFSPRENKLAVALGPRNARSGLLAAWNLEDGSLLSAFLFPNVSKPGIWVSATELLVGDLLVDVELETAVWWLSPGVPPDRLAEVTASNAIFPDASAQATINASKSRWPAWVGTINGLQLRVVATSDMPLREEFTRRVTDQLAQWAKDAGVRIDAGAADVLRVDLTTSVDNESTYRIRGNGQEWMVPRWRFRLNARWEGSQVAQNPTASYQVELQQIAYQMKPSAVDPQEEVARVMQDALLAGFARRSIFKKYQYLHRGFGQSAYGANR